MSRDGMISPGTERCVQGRNDMLGDGTICPGTERYVQGRNDISRDGKICPGTERYVQGRNDMLGDGTRDGTQRNETERGAERNATERKALKSRCGLCINYLNTKFMSYILKFCFPQKREHFDFTNWQDFVLRIYWIFWIF